MDSISDMPRQWAENEADAFAEALRRMKPDEEVKFCAYDSGYKDGYKAAEEKILHCMEVPTRAAAKLTEENARLKEENKRLREAFLRQQEEWYD